jgi:uncharacterized protein YigA (DUF484 family)
MVSCGRSHLCPEMQATFHQGKEQSMSTQRKPEYVEETVSEDDIQNFLQDNTDFFERHPALLSSLRLPHVSGVAVSLVERQVSVLRAKDLKLERRLKELLEVARANDTLASKIHTLTLQLLSAGDLVATLEVIETALRTGFDADQSILVLFAEPELFGDVNIGRFFKPIDRKDKSLKAFETFLDGTGPRCGQVRDAQRDFLFGKDTDEIGSAALVPLGKKSELGFLAIGSADANRFHPGMSIDFLARLGELIAGALKRF